MAEPTRVGGSLLRPLIAARPLMAWLRRSWPTRSVILDDDVGIADQTPHELLALLGAQVHAKTALVTPAEQEEDADPVQISLSPRPVTLPRPSRRLYLDHVGPEVGQDLHRGGALQKVREA